MQYFELLDEFGSIELIDQGHFAVLGDGTLVYDLPLVPLEVKINFVGGVAKGTEAHVRAVVLLIVQI